MEDDKEKEWGEISGICDLQNEVNKKTEENDGKSSKHHVHHVSIVYKYRQLLSGVQSTLISSHVHVSKVIHARNEIGHELEQKKVLYCAATKINIPLFSRSG